MKKLLFLEYNAFIDDAGSLIYSDNTKRDIQEFINQNLESEITIRMSAEFTRSKAQNSLQHLIYPAIGSALILSGDTNPLLLNLEYVKQKRVKPMFLTMYKDTPDQYVRSTADLTVAESWEYTQSLIKYLIMIGGVIDQKTQNAYLKIVEKYKLEKVIDDYMSRGD